MKDSGNFNKRFSTNHRSLCSHCPLGFPSIPELWVPSIRYAPSIHLSIHPNKQTNKQTANKQSERRNARKWKDWKFWPQLVSIKTKKKQNWILQLHLTVRALSLPLYFCHRLQLWLYRCFCLSVRPSVRLCLSVCLSVLFYRLPLNLSLVFPLSSFLWNEGTTKTFVSHDRLQIQQIFSKALPFSRCSEEAVRRYSGLLLRTLTSLATRKPLWCHWKRSACRDCFEAILYRFRNHNLT